MTHKLKNTPTLTHKNWQKAKLDATKMARAIKKIGGHTEDPDKEMQAFKALMASFRGGLTPKLKAFQACIKKYKSKPKEVSDRLVVLSQEIEELSFQYSKRAIKYGKDIGYMALNDKSKRPDVILNGVPYNIFKEFQAFRKANERSLVDISSSTLGN